jgi:hypothetical protein
MSGWKDLKVGIRSAANKVICRTDELAEEASLTLKKKSAEAHLAEAYERLGRAAYRVLSDKKYEVENIRADQSIESLIGEVEDRRKEVRCLKSALLRIHNTKKETSSAEQESTDKEASEQ